MWLPAAAEIKVGVQVDDQERPKVTLAAFGRSQHVHAFLLVLLTQPVRQAQVATPGNFVPAPKDHWLQACQQRWACRAYPVGRNEDEFDCVLELRGGCWEQRLGLGPTLQTDCASPAARKRAYSALIRLTPSSAGHATNKGIAKPCMWLYPSTQLFMWPYLSINQAIHVAVSINQAWDAPFRIKGVMLLARRTWGQPGHTGVMLLARRIWGGVCWAVDAKELCCLLDVSGVVFVGQ